MKRKNYKRFTREEAENLMGSRVRAQGFKEVPPDAPGVVSGVQEKSRGCNLLVDFQYQRLMFGLAWHSHEVTRRQFEHFLKLSIAIP